MSCLFNGWDEATWDDMPFYNGGMRLLGMCCVMDEKTWDGPAWDELSHLL